MRYFRAALRSSLYRFIIRERFREVDSILSQMARPSYVGSKLIESKKDSEVRQELHPDRSRIENTSFS